MIGQCKRCGGMFAIDNAGHFKRKHGTRIARCPGHRELAVGYGIQKTYSRTPIIRHSLGKV